jgi:hypothetical protein
MRIPGAWLVGTRALVASAGVALALSGGAAADGGPHQLRVLFVGNSLEPW